MPKRKRTPKTRRKSTIRGEKPFNRSRVRSKGNVEPNSFGELLVPLETRSRSGEVTVVEPFTWAWVGLKLVEGVIAWAGGKMFESMFGKGQNLNELMKDFIHAIEVIVREVIQENELRRVGANLDALQRNFLHYLNAPQGVDRLLEATTNVTNVVADLRSLKLPGHHAFMVAINVQLAVLQERVKKFGEEDKLNIAETLNFGIAEAERRHEEWKIWTDARFWVTGIPETKIEFSLRHGYKPTRPRFPRYYLLKDGRSIESFGLASAAIAALKEARRSEWKKVIFPRQVAPSIKIVEGWKKAAESVGLSVTERLYLR